MDYTLIRSSRRTLAIQIDREGSLVVRAPRLYPVYLIERFIESKKSWIQKHQQRVEDRKQKTERKQYSDGEIHEMKKKLTEYLIHRVRELWEGRGLPEYTSIKITKSERRWGSCSGKNGLCFSYRLAEYLDVPPIFSSRGTMCDQREPYPRMRASDEVGATHEWGEDLLQSETEADSSYRQNDKTRFIDAVIIHELAHLREKHHQASFWRLVYSMMPEYESIMREQKIDG